MGLLRSAANKCWVVGPLELLSVLLKIKATLLALAAGSVALILSTA